jgi:hypothetical protein
MRGGELGLEMTTGVRVLKGSKPPDFAKQTIFATASALTQMAKEGQTAAIGSIEGTFTVRNNWDRPSNKFGVKITPAKKDSLVSEVYTLADWLGLHEEGGTKQPGNKFLAIPTANVRRTKRQIIQKGQRPAGLRGKGDIVIEGKNGKAVLYQRKGKGKSSKLVAMYILVPIARVRKQSTIFEPIQKLFVKRFGTIFDQQLRKALETAK